MNWLEWYEGLPTPEEIREHCRQIQATWSTEEERDRRAWSIPPSKIAGAEKFACVVHQPARAGASNRG